LSANTNKWKKRAVKLRGLWNQIRSALFLRYSSFHRRRLEKNIQVRSIDRLHAGCGNVFLPGWLNVTYEPREEYGRVKETAGTCVLNYNLLKPWPVGKDSIRFIAASHFIEHLDLNEGIWFLKESFRVMKSGGIIRLSCPDLELYAQNYVRGNKDFFEHKLIREWCTFSQAQTPGEIFAAKAYDSGGSHKWFYDFDSLKHILESAGFRHVRRCRRLEGDVPDLEAIDLPGRELETVYVEAVK
jgi:predicted SAM-dependent methyltransferase